MTNYLEIHTLMKAIQEIRRANLELLREIAEQDYKEQHGQNKKYTDLMFSEYAGISQPHYSMIKNSKLDVNFTEKTARRIELSVELPIGWLDIDHETDNYSNVFLSGQLIEQLVLGFIEFIDLDYVDVKGKPDLLEKLIQQAILKTSKYQEISFKDLGDIFFDLVKK